MVSDPLAVILEIAGIFEDLGIPYAVGGSVASSVYGEPRASADADLIADLPEAKLVALTSRIEASYYVSEVAARDAVRRHSSFNIIHLDSMYKIDIFVAGSSRLDRDQLQRRIRLELVAEPPSSAFITAAENIVLRKLDWYRQSGEASERQWRDVLGVLKVQADNLDMLYLQQAARDAGLDELLERALEQARTDDD